MNSTIINGYMVEEPFMSETKAGVPVANFELAHRRNTKAPLEIFVCAAFSKTALYIKGNFLKGDLCLVQGNLTINRWVDRSGTPRSAVKIIVNDIEHQNLQLEDIPEEELHMGGDEFYEEPDYSPIYSDDSRLLSKYR